MKDLALAEKGCGIEKESFFLLLNESHDKRDVPAQGLKLFEQRIGPRLESHFLDHVFKSVTCEAKLGEDKKICLFPLCLLDAVDVHVEVFPYVSQLWADLSQSNFHDAKIIIISCALQFTRVELKYEREIEKLHLFIL